MNINWEEYYKQFAVFHGRDPVLYLQDKETGEGGYLLFPDGWMYSRSNPSGPEYPPSDHLDAFTKIKHYWTHRLIIVRKAYRLARTTFEDLVQAQHTRSAPLQVIEQVIQEDEETGKQNSRMVASSINFQIELGKLRDLWSDVVRCREMLKDIKIPESTFAQREFNPAGVLIELENIEREETTVNQ